MPVHKNILFIDFIYLLCHPSIYPSRHWGPSILNFFDAKVSRNSVPAMSLKVAGAYRNRLRHYLFKEEEVVAKVLFEN